MGYFYDRLLYECQGNVAMRQIEEYNYLVHILGMASYVSSYVSAFVSDQGPVNNPAVQS